MELWTLKWVCLWLERKEERKHVPFGFQRSNEMQENNVRETTEKNTKTTSELLRLLPLIIAGFQTRLVLLSVLKIKFEEEKCEILDLLPFVIFCHL